MRAILEKVTSMTDSIHQTDVINVERRVENCSTSLREVALIVRPTSCVVIIMLTGDHCYSRIAGQQSREEYGEQITNVANAPTIYRQ